MYVDTGLHVLLEQVTAGGASVEDIRVAYAGGASVLTVGTQNMADIGARNLQALEQGISNLGLLCVASDGGGHAGRALTLDTKAGNITVQGNDEEGRVLCTLAA